MIKDGVVDYQGALHWNEVSAEDVDNYGAVIVKRHVKTSIIGASLKIRCYNWSIATLYTLSNQHIFPPLLHPTNTAPAAAPKPPNARQTEKPLAFQ